MEIKMARPKGSGKASKAEESESVSVNSAEDIKNKFNSALKKKVFQTFVEDDDIEIERLSTGILSLDLILGKGREGKYGWPKGRINEIYGPNSTGKSSVVLATIAEAQREGGLALLVDSEQVFDPSYAVKLGVDLDRLIVVNPDHGEEGYDAALLAANSGEFSLIVIDSVEGMIPKSMVEGTMEDQFMGTQPRLNNRFLKQIAGALRKSNCTMLLVNQLRQKIGVMYGNPETVPGGGGIPFWCSIILDIRKVEDVEKNGTKIGHIIKGVTKKNKTSRPQQQAEFQIIWGEGFNPFFCLSKQAINLGIVEKAGAWFSYGDKKWQGQAQLVEAMQEDTELTELIRNGILSHDRS